MFHMELKQTFFLMYLGLRIGVDSERTDFYMVPSTSTPEGKALLAPVCWEFAGVMIEEGETPKDAAIANFVQELRC